ncbi:TPA: SDR family NAD(P)-dependent oxidoreductase, partial [Klebsiella pneumoniae subsp. pneumoniae]|nr:SDR family NAD(P)-dependent oxidoreductase [Klebsiella pneumoniae subsp. pneumoniae]HDU4945134.1 SDR family NAD(P)-dependent oxidoreductase [Klebsiella pneumoniae subsp. ozaenae]
MLLKDKVAIITGAASARGLGFATAKLFAENGAKVVIIDLNGEASKTAAAA